MGIMNILEAETLITNNRGINNTGVNKAENINVEIKK